jgi:hypothetical protein
VAVNKPISGKMEEGKVAEVSYNMSGPDDTAGYI